MKMLFILSLMSAPAFASDLLAEASFGKENALQKVAVDATLARCRDVSLQISGNFIVKEIAVTFSDNTQQTLISEDEFENDGQESMNVLGNGHSERFQLSGERPIKHLVAHGRSMRSGNDAVVRLHCTR